MFVAGGLGANPHPALALEEFTAREDLLPTIESLLRVFDQAGNRDNKLRARMKWLVDTLGFEELQRRVFKDAAPAARLVQLAGRHPRAEVEKFGDAPAGVAADVAPTPMGQGTPVALRRAGAYERWEDANVVRGVAKGTVSAYAYAHLGDVTADQFRAWPRPSGSWAPRSASPTARTSCSVASPRASCPVLFSRLEAIGMAEPGAELVRDVVACPGADTCNLAVTQSRGLADAIGAALEEEGLAEVGGVRINISGCTNSCGQHHIADIGFFGAERRAHGKSAPGYQMLLGGYVGEEQIHFGEKALRLPAKNAPEAAVRVVRRFNDERSAGESFRDWLDRSGGAKAIGRRAEGARPVPLPRGGPGLLRRLRRDRPLRRRDRRVGVRHMSLTNLSAPASSPTPSLAELSTRVRVVARRPQVIEWAVDNFAPHLALTASMTDAVLIDLAVKVDPAIEVVFIDTGYHFPETLETVEEVRRRYGLNLRIMTVRPPGRGAVAGRPRELLLGGQGRPARPGPRRQGGLDERAAPGRGRQPGAGADRGPRPAGPGQGQPDRHLDRPRRAGLHRRPRRPGEPAASRRATRRSAACPARCSPPTPDDPRSGRWAGREQDGVRPARDVTAVPP